MKKTNSKTTSPAPATSSAAKPAKKRSTAKASAAAVPLTAAPAASPAPQSTATKPSASAPTIKSVAPAAPKVTPVVPSEPKAIAASKVQTKIIAKVDVGFGNALYVRGDGPGLNWSQGVPMQCVASDQWELTLGESARPISFKVLINDATWCTGPDGVVASGSTTTISPEFA